MVNENIKLDTGTEPVTKLAITCCRADCSNAVNGAVLSVYYNGELSLCSR